MQVRSTTGLSAKRPKILIVDDVLANLVLYSSALKSQHETLTASSGEEAIQIARRERPDLILLDIMMPGMDGFATAEKLFAIEELKHTPVIFLTAMTESDMHVRGLSMGAVDFINKPVSMPVLRHRVDGVLERDRLLKEAIEREHEMQALLARQLMLSNTLHSAFNVTNDSLIITDEHFVVLKSNENADRMFASRIPELQGIRLSDLVFREPDGRIIALRDLLGSQRHECCIEMPDEQVLYAEVSVRSYDIGQGATHILFSVQDIGERLALECSKQQSARKLNELVEELSKQKQALDEHALVSITDANGIITYANRKFCDRSGYSQEELIGRTHNIVKSGEHPPAFYDDLWQTIAGGKIWHGQITNRDRHGDLYWVDSTIVPWLDDNGIPYQYLAIRTEISDRIRAEQQVAQARRREIETGAAIQQRLLFGTPPTDFPGVSVSSYTEASQGIDGDFYTFTRIAPHVFEVLVGDVMGKGIAAALIGAGIKSTYRKILIDSLASRGDGTFPSPAEIINAIHAEVTPELIRFDTFVTLSLLRFDRQAMTLTWVNAGHTPALLARQDAVQIERLLGDNLPVGVMENEVYQEFVTTLQVGDTLLSYSDGISETTNLQGEFYGEEKIASILARGQAFGASSSILLHSLRSDILDYSERIDGTDDRTAIVIQMRPMRSNTRGRISDRKTPEYLDLPRELAKLTPLRQRIASLAADQPEEIVNALTLAAFEAATNIIRHTPEKLRDAPLTAVLQRSQTSLDVSLVYAGQVFQANEPPSPDFSGLSEGGFGLFIIENSVDRCVYDSPLPGLARISLSKQLQALSPANEGLPA